MAERPRFHVRWTLRVDTDEPAVLRDAVAPEADGYHTLDVDEERLVATGAGGPGEALHTLDDLLACLTAAIGTSGSRP